MEANEYRYKITVGSGSTLAGGWKKYHIDALKAAVAEARKLIRGLAPGSTLYVEIIDAEGQNITPNESEITTHKGRTISFRAPKNPRNEARS